MTNQKLYEMTEQIRAELHDMVDRQINDFQTRLQYGTPKIRTDIEMSLSTMPAYFKGKKPISIVYPDGTEVYASNWRQLAHHLLKGCTEDGVMLDRLHDLCGKVSGRDRLLFADSGDGMDAPIEFYPKMFFEGKFDTESLLKVITTRIFDPIGYDYSGINLKVYDPALKALAAEQSDAPEQVESDIEEDESEGFGMQMM